MKYFSTFSGIGGFELGTGKDHECVGFSEIDKYATQIYQKHFPNHKNYGDITKLNTADLPDFDLLVGGFPCQAFSVAGKRKGFEDTRGTLFFELARILRDKRPRYFVFENVKGLLSHDKGKTLQRIFEVLTDIGYEYQWQVLNSKDFGVPQNRERIFIVGHLREERRPEVFPLTSNAGTSLEYVEGIMTEKSKKLLDDGKKLSRNFPQGNRVYSADGISSTLASQAGGLGAKTGLYAVTVNYEEAKRKIGLKKVNVANTLTATSYKGVDAANRNVAFIDLSTKEAKLTKEARTIQARYNKGYSKRKGENSGVFYPMQWRRSKEGKKARAENQKKGRDYTPFGEKYRELVPNPDKDVVGTLTSQAIAKDSLIGNEYFIRRLTPTECERLQGFPDGWTEGISDTQRYKCLGNAVTVNVIKAIFSHLSPLTQAVKTDTIYTERTRG